MSYRLYRLGDAPIMEKPEITQEDLERYAERMARAISDLDCPECCEQGWKYQYVELSCALYREEWEWHCLAVALRSYRLRTKNPGP
ncbi:MAG TPA: hypothetical protein VEC01_04260 [Noviherbaspirillum sp.]|uniref:hypothetical protein n=1 Tax=Noviherbaspirillum sp. TaxID=1926288 RepID=UPI002D550AE0|nr:hypothetical protein [Noviherbaspirillum sp.]HYD94516.1 hypothetical protein [Noviherbaspirillum sp.]